MLSVCVFKASYTFVNVLAFLNQFLDVAQPATALKNKWQKVKEVTVAVIKKYA